ncbi:hypothetical protein BJ138DRAFT_1125977 [Hygrophoropsis aurantiaca]|uniref:Uncharacterized protein n=1 Tax=Hygrophoropsis aurantiaca TaxID=72124 RepID=A0ACB8ADQ3_9AGAM|nr:hypothetical protein BJ138DRAFT_1125977 [Hygrophoropsis aurantiaca]
MAEKQKDSTTIDLTESPRRPPLPLPTPTTSRNLYPRLTSRSRGNSQFPSASHSQTSRAVSPTIGFDPETMDLGYPSDGQEEYEEASSSTGDLQTSRKRRRVGSDEPRESDETESQVDQLDEESYLPTVYQREQSDNAIADSATDTSTGESTQVGGTHISTWMMPQLDSQSPISLSSPTLPPTQMTNESEPSLSRPSTPSRSGDPITTAISPEITIISERTAASPRSIPDTSGDVIVVSPALRSRALEGDVQNIQTLASTNKRRRTPIARLPADPSSASSTGPIASSSTLPSSGQSHPQHPQPEPLAAYICPICFSPPTNATLTPCGHICCGACLFTAVKSTIKRNMVVAMDRAPLPCCPVCRAEIPGWDGRGGGVIGLQMQVVYSL